MHLLVVNINAVAFRKVIKEGKLDGGTLQIATLPSSSGNLVVYASWFGSGTVDPALAVLTKCNIFLHRTCMR